MDLLAPLLGRTLVIVAHPDDVEYGTASAVAEMAVAQWNSQRTETLFPFRLLLVSSLGSIP